MGLIARVASNDKASNCTRCIELLIPCQCYQSIYIAQATILHVYNLLIDCMHANSYLVAVVIR